MNCMTCIPFIHIVQTGEPTDAKHISIILMISVDTDIRWPEDNVLLVTTICFVISREIVHRSQLR